MVLNDLSMELKKKVQLFVTGFVMGTADLVPGVSGGTIAFIAGIYEELLQSIKLVSGPVLRAILKVKLRNAIVMTPFSFLLPLGFGILAAIFSLSNLLSYLLATHPVYVWSFFFGLVVASAWVVRNRIINWKLHTILGAVVAAVVGYVIVGAVPVETPNTIPMLFLSGAIAICAMILPGISGSFLLVIMGKYGQILQAVVERDFLTLGIFAAGCAIGLALFARVLSWLFAHYHDIAVAVLIGLMVGSLRKVWPWREVIETYVNDHGEVLPLIERNTLPPAYDMSFFVAVSLMIAAIVLMLYLERLNVTDEEQDFLEEESQPTA